MHEAPLVSVVIPVYNCAKYVRDAISSVLQQSIGSHKIETLVIDDGSSDETPNVVRTFGTAVRLIELQHGGVSKARNAGIALARAPIVAFLDSDDYWLPRRLEHALALLHTDEHSFVTTDFYVETAGVRDPDGYYRSRALRGVFELSAAAQLAFALEDNFINAQVIARRQTLLECGGFNSALRYGEDWDLWLRMLRAGHAARLVREPLAVYRYLRPGATTTRHDAGMARDRLFVLAQYREAVSPYRWKRAKALARRLAFREVFGRLAVPHA